MFSNTIRKYLGYFKHTESNKSNHNNVRNKWNLLTEEQLPALELTKNSEKKNPQYYGLMTHLLKSYGNLFDVLTLWRRIEELFFADKKNKFFNSLNKLIPMFILGRDLKYKIEDYYKQDYDVVVSFVKRLEILIGVEDLNSMDSGDIKLTSECIKWLVSLPETKNFKIVNFYNYEKFDKLSSVSIDISKFLIVMEHNNYKYVFICTNTSLDTPKYEVEKMYTSRYDWTELKELEKTIYREYVKTLKLEDNVILYNDEISTRKRNLTADFKVYSFDYENYKKELIISLEEKCKRGQIFVGNPGTGKSSILLKLETDIRNYPIIYVSGGIIGYENKIELLFSFLESLTPCIVVFEDFDSFGLGSKDDNEELATFLNYIDNSKKKLDVIYIATINNSKCLNSSLVRSGRLGELIEIKEPTHNEEIYNIMKFHYDHNKLHTDHYSQIPFIKQNDISLFTYWRLKRHKLTQSDYVEILQKIILNKEKITNSTIIQKRNNIIKSKQLYKKYKLND
jgi:hypothetical protein